MRNQLLRRKIDFKCRGSDKVNFLLNDFCESLLAKSQHTNSQQTSRVTWTHSDRSVLSSREQSLWVTSAPTISQFWKQTKRKFIRNFSPSIRETLVLYYLTKYVAKFLWKVQCKVQTPKPTFGVGQLSKDLSDLLMSQNVKKTQFVLANSSFEGTEMQGYGVNLVTNTIYWNTLGPLHQRYSRVRNAVFPFQSAWPDGYIICLKFGHLQQWKIV